MPQLTILYDEDDPPIMIAPTGTRLKVATLPIAAGLDPVDIYQVAIGVATMLLEQLTVGDADNHD